MEQLQPTVVRSATIAASENAARRPAKSSGYVSEQDRSLWIGRSSAGDAPCRASASRATTSTSLASRTSAVSQRAMSSAGTKSPASRAAGAHRALAAPHTEPGDRDRRAFGSARGARAIADLRAIRVAAAFTTCGTPISARCSAVPVRSLPQPCASRRWSQRQSEAERALLTRR